MELKHFSHSHFLVPLQLHEPSTTLCSGCKSPASGDVYTCSECNFFLHHQCYHAPRSLNHPSHPLHPLTLMPYPTYPSQSFLCDSCGAAGFGFSYGCSSCDYDAHLHCALTPITQPEIKPQWLGLESVTRPDHEHPLALYSSSPYAETIVFGCDVCGGRIAGAAPMYCCRDCDFGTHVECVERKVERKEENEEIAAQIVRLQMMNMNSQMQLQQLQLQMNSQLHMQSSGFSASMFQHIKDSI